MMDPHFSNWLNSFPFPHNRADGDRPPDPSGVGEFAIRVDGRFAGLAIAAPEVGLWITREYRRQGVALRAGTLALSRYFASGAEVAYARSPVSSHALRGILERFGFTIDGAGIATEGGASLVAPQERGDGQSAVPSGGGLLLHRLLAADFAARLPLVVTTPRCLVERVAVPRGEGLSQIVPGFAVTALLDFKAAEQARGMVAHLPGGQGATMLRISTAGRPVGLIEIGPGREPALALWLSPEMRGRGFGTEVLPAVCAELGARYALGSVWADVALENRAARRLFLRAGFVAERPVMVRPIQSSREGSGSARDDLGGVSGIRFRLILN